MRTTSSSCEFRTSTFCGFHRQRHLFGILIYCSFSIRRSLLCEVDVSGRNNVTILLFFDSYSVFENYSRSYFIIQWLSERNFWLL